MMRVGQTVHMPIEGLNVLESISHHVISIFYGQHIEGQNKYSLIYLNPFILYIFYLYLRTLLNANHKVLARKKLRKTYHPLL